VTATPAANVAVDNDVVLKAVCYRLFGELWSGLERPGVLGSARYVLAHAIKKRARVRDRDGAREALETALAAAGVLEPDEQELIDAAALEELAQRGGVALDVGESQLAAIVVRRGMMFLDTGDKRAVRGFEELIEHSATCAALAGRVRCLEQLILGLVGREELMEGVCTEPEIDKTLAICFGCHSGGQGDAGQVEEGLESYIGALARAAPRVLAAALNDS
jgi:hypothetical protein